MVGINQINVLSKEISELIAAGEVIDRPSSVIKELLENSIDSGASNITVEIKNGGTSYMRITDNGSGIDEADVPLAFLRNATSKIHSKDDLDSIMSLGFRGEALASVSAISRVDMISKKIGEQYGTHYIIEGSEEKLLEKSGCPEGTTIVIRDIFYNVPARLKFLKKDVTEGNSISAIVNKLALSHPEISIKFIRDNKQELFTAGDGKLYSAIYSVFGKVFAQSLIAVDYTFNNITVKGYTIKPLSSRANRSLQSFFINNRYVKSVTCTVALDEAYRNSIMIGKFPACVLNLDIPPNIVDVNVHPAKIEVRFSNEKMIFDSVFFAIKNALLSNDTLNELKINDNKNFTKHELYHMPPVEQEPINQLEFNMHNLTLNSKKADYFKSSNETSFVAKENINNNIDDIDINIVIEKNIQEFTETSKISEFKYLNTNAFIKKEEIKQSNPQSATLISPKIIVIGEAFSTYIIAQINDEILLVDKHAAHERYIFEQIKADKENLDSQIFLVPVSITLSFEEYDALMTNLNKINQLGFIIESNDAPIINVLGVPIIINEINPNDIIPELAKNFLDYNENPSLEIIEELYHSIACKKAIKANDKSNILELQALVESVYDKDNIKYCPHGRPIFIKLTKKEIEKQFKRI